MLISWTGESVRAWEPVRPRSPLLAHFDLGPELNAHRRHKRHSLAQLSPVGRPFALWDLGWRLHGPEDGVAITTASLFPRGWVSNLRRLRVTQSCAKHYMSPEDICRCQIKTGDSVSPDSLPQGVPSTFCFKITKEAELESGEQDKHGTSSPCSLLAVSCKAWLTF
jgi:hypothetical protein